MAKLIKAHAVLYIMIPLQSKFNPSLWGWLWRVCTVCMCASFYVGVCVQWVKLMVAAVGALLPPRAQSELSSSSLCIKWQTTLCSCPLKRRAQLEWKMWHFIIIYVYVSARGSASLWKASFENKPGLLLSPLPRGNWWRYPTMPEPISSCWLVEGGGGGGRLPLCSPQSKRL